MPLWAINRPYWVKVGDEPFINRRVLFICPLFGVFDTVIHAPDRDRRPHDHSRPFISLIISGGYGEKVWYDVSDMRTYRMRWHGRWSVHFMPAHAAHSIVNVRKTLRTLVIAGRSRGTWSFWVPGTGKVDWKVYDEHL